MNDHRQRRSGGRSRRGSRRSSSRHSDTPRSEARASQSTASPTFWQRIKSLFGFGPKKQAYPVYQSRTQDVSNAGRKTAEPQAERTPRPPSRKPEAVEVTSPKLYIGNLSFDAAESDLTELFNGVGTVQAAEIVSNRETHKSKGFGFVTMTTVDEAKRAVDELHDKDFMGRKLVVSGAKTPVDRAA
jgi:hypothetical protein